MTEEPVEVEVAERPGDEGGTATVQTTVVVNEALGASAEIPTKSLPLWQEYGWVEGTFEEGVEAEGENAEQPEYGEVDPEAEQLPVEEPEES